MDLQGFTKRYPFSYESNEANIHIFINKPYVSAKITS